MCFLEERGEEGMKRQQTDTEEEEMLRQDGRSEGGVGSCLVYPWERRRRWRPAGELCRGTQPENGAGSKVNGVLRSNAS